MEAERGEEEQGERKGRKEVKKGKKVKEVKGRSHRGLENASPVLFPGGFLST